MAQSTAEALRNRLIHLHRGKDAAYRDAWKKRGEVMSIVANIARKVDRLEYALDGAPATVDESLFDTIVDLLVYALKYQTYLADQDSAVAASLMGEHRLSAPYSDGSSGFEVLLARLDLTPLERSERLEVMDAGREVLNAFADLEACFIGLPKPVDYRSVRVRTLTDTTVVLLGALVREAPQPCREFLAVHRDGSD